MERQVLNGNQSKGLGALRYTNPYKLKSINAGILRQVTEAATPGR